MYKIDGIRQFVQLQVRPIMADEIKATNDWKYNPMKRQHHQMKLRNTGRLSGWSQGAMIYVRDPEATPANYDVGRGISTLR